MIGGHAMAKFLALRRTSRAQTLGLAAASVEDRRTRLLEPLPEEHSAVLRGVGLKQLRPEDWSPEAEDSFEQLGTVGAYVVDAVDPDKGQRAREALESDYLIVPNIPLSLPTPRLNQVRLKARPRSDPWPDDSGIAVARTNGATGQGVLVGVLDTGCDADHVEFAGKRVEFRYVPFNPAPERLRAVRGFDVDGHGTHVCGIIAGRNVGVAPGAELMVASVIESETIRTSLERIVAALDWMLSHFRQPEHVGKPTIINMSLGFRPDWISPPDVQAVVAGIRLLIETLVNDFDVLPVIAIGNDGAGFVRAPAYFPDVLSVGAVGFDGVPADFSGGGPAPVPFNTVEPDVAGYGVGVASSLERDVDRRSRYARLSGTSMATPYVAGIAALLASANPGLHGMALRQRIITNALALPAPPDRVGSGLARFA
jgi:subtilisin family serine protease